ncbi:hypothetical protein ACTFQO_01865 [Bacillus cereus group sp. MYBK29-1]|uniref:hypothetical protein n=1 Tax=Bacillus cereus group TaxID=86661 RepID=UPI000B4A8A8B
MQFSITKIRNSIVLILSFFIISACEQQNTNTQTANTKKETVTIKDNTQTEEQVKSEEQTKPAEQTKITKKQNQTTNVSITANKAKEILTEKFGTLDENKVTYNLLPNEGFSKNKINNKSDTDYYTFTPQFDNHRADFTFSVHKQTGEVIVNLSDGSTLTESEFKNTQETLQVNKQQEKKLNKPADIIKFTSEDAIKIVEKRMGTLSDQIHYNSSEDQLIGTINGIKLYDVLYVRGEGEHQRAINFAVGSNGILYDWFKAQDGILQPLNGN